MRRSTIYIYLIVTAITATAISTASFNDWKIIESQEINGVTTTLKIRQQPSLATKNWISINFDNRTPDVLQIQNAAYSIHCNVYDKKDGKLLKQGQITSRSTLELLDKAIDSPIPTIDLQPGLSISSKFPSTIGALFLSVPKKSKVYVEAVLKLEVQFAGQENFIFRWEQIPFDFEWFRPEPVEFSKLYLRLDTLLSNPVYSSLQHFELSSLLASSNVSKGVEASTLLNALRIRNSKEDGRLAILYHLNDHFSNDSELLNYYFELLKSNPIQAVDELSKTEKIWDNRFLEPIIAAYQTGNNRQMHCIMNLLYIHQQDWIKQKEISTILSDIILYKNEEIIYQEPEYLTKRELLTASLLIDMLGKTGNQEVIPIICPFLDEYERILDTGLVLDPNSLELPRPMRVCDNALEAIMRLKKIDLIKTYKKAKFKPPYENGDGEVIITKIRNDMINAFLKKGCE